MLRVGPIPLQVTQDNGSRVGLVTTRTGLVGYSHDGSFAIGIASGCVPMFKCGLNEPTDWEIGAK